MFILGYHWFYSKNFQYAGRNEYKTSIGPLLLEQSDLGLQRLHTIAQDYILTVMVTWSKRRDKMTK